MAGIPTTIAQIDALLAAGGIDQKTANYWEARKGQLSVDLQMQSILDAIARAKASGNEVKYYNDNKSDAILVTSFDAVTKAQLGAQNQVTDAVRLLGTSKSQEELNQITAATDLLNQQVEEAKLKVKDHAANTTLASDVAKANIAQSQASAAASGASAAASQANAQVALAQLKQLEAQQQRTLDFQIWQKDMGPKLGAGEITDAQYQAGIQAFMSSAEAVMSTQIQLGQLQLAKDSQTQLATQFKDKMGFDQDQADVAATRWKASFDQAAEQFTQTGVWKQAEIDLGNRNATTQENQLALAQRNAEAQTRATAFSMAQSESDRQSKNALAVEGVKAQRQTAYQTALNQYQQTGWATQGAQDILNDLRKPLAPEVVAQMAGIPANSDQFKKLYEMYQQALMPAGAGGPSQGMPEAGGPPPEALPQGPDFRPMQQPTFSPSPPGSMPPGPPPVVDRYMAGTGGYTSP
ncbi:MAG: hypothetical protein WCO52_06110, partial [bacterium]